MNSPSVRCAADGSGSAAFRGKARYKGKHLLDHQCDQRLPDDRSYGGFSWESDFCNGYVDGAFTGAWHGAFQKDGCSVGIRKERML